MGDPLNMIDDTDSGTGAAIISTVGDPAATNDAALPPDIAAGYAAPGSWQAATDHPMIAPPDAGPTTAASVVSSSTRLAIGLGLAALVLAAIVVATPKRRRH